MKEDRAGGTGRPNISLPEISRNDAENGPEHRDCLNKSEWLLPTNPLALAHGFGSLPPNEAVDSSPVEEERTPYFCMTGTSSYCFHVPTRPCSAQGQSRQSLADMPRFGHSPTWEGSFAALPPRGEVEAKRGPCGWVGTAKSEWSIGSFFAQPPRCLPYPAKGLT